MNETHCGGYCASNGDNIVLGPTGRSERSELQVHASDTAYTAYAAKLGTALAAALAATLALATALAT
eukprot:6684528-Heterocapsa_arctica.AAC.1